LKVREGFFQVSQKRHTADQTMAPDGIRQQVK